LTRTENIECSVFDFDHTLIKRNCMPMIFFTVGGFWNVCKCVVKIIFIKGIFNPKFVKEEIKIFLVREILAKKNSVELRENIYKTKYKFPVNHEVLEILYKCKSRGEKVYILTASPEDFVKPLIDKWGWPVDAVIGTKLKSKGGIYTGELGVEFSGESKGEYVREMLAGNFFVKVAIGNLPHDEPILKLAEKSYAVKNQKLYTYSLCQLSMVAK